MSDPFGSRFDVNQIPLTENSVDDEAGISKSVEQINQLISSEVESGTLPNRIVLGGFSQGGAMSLFTGLTGERKLAGVVSLSGWLPLRNKIKSVSTFPKLHSSMSVTITHCYSHYLQLASPHASSIPVFLGHGSADPIVDPPIAEVSKEFLTSSLDVPTLGLTYNIYPGMGHSTVPKELDDVIAWIKQVLPA